MNQSVDVLRRDSLQVVARFGQGGRYPGQFYSVHSISVDSAGNIYTGETLEGKRLQRFILQSERRARTAGWFAQRPKTHRGGEVFERRAA